MPYKYTGDGRFVAGLPARDLDDEEVSDELAEQIKDVEAADEEAAASLPTPIYRSMTKAEAKDHAATPEAKTRAAARKGAAAPTPAAPEPEQPALSEGG